MKTFSASSKSEDSFAKVKYGKKIIFNLLGLGISLVGLIGCAEEQDPNNPNTNNPNNPNPIVSVEVTATSPEFIFWGDELTLTGKGFSTKLEDNFVWLKNETAAFGSCSSDNRADSTGWRKATVLRATATSLTIKIPYKTASENSNNRACGVINPNISVTVNGKTAVSEKVKLLGIPHIREICYSNSGYKGAGMIPGKELENQISIPGVGLYGASSGIDKKMKLLVNGVYLPLTKVESTGPTNCADSYKFVIPIEFANGNCATADPVLTGRFANMMDFVAVIDGTTKSSEKLTYPVSSFPDRSYSTFTQRSFSYSAAGNPEIVLTGKGLNWYPEARFSPQGSTGCTLATIGPVHSESGTKLTILVPLAQMQSGCSYILTLVDVCGRVSNQVGQVTIGA
ncbi:hypothetical protein [Aquiflexum sp.]|uniref:hypothetical protein n=1 Tax=Aquiflexum sp. TaxID=1872584 RepID=UPI0035939B1F